LSEEHGEALTPGQEELHKELMVRQMALAVLRKEWVEHHYGGHDPGNPEAYDEAMITVARKYDDDDWDIPEETSEKAVAFIYAVEKLQETIDMAKAEVALTGDVEDLNRALEELKGEEEPDS